MVLDRDDRTVAVRAADALLDAGDRARRRMESRTAIEYYEKTLALAGIGEARYWLGEYPAPSCLEARGCRGQKLRSPL